VSSRREFLVASAAVVGGVLFASVEGCGGEDPTKVEADIAALLPASAIVVGKAWRKLASADEDPATPLLAALRDAGVDLADPAAVGEGLRRLVLDDFAGGRTVEVQGWVLSISECRLAALSR